MEDTFAKKSIEDMIEQYAEVEGVLKNFNGEDVWMLGNGATVRLPADFSRIPYAKVQLIAEIKLEMSGWEFDYWLGVNGNQIN